MFLLAKMNNKLYQAALFPFILLLSLFFFFHREEPKTFAVFFTSDNRSISQTLPTKLSNLDLLMPVCFYLKDDQGEIQIDDPHQLSVILDLVRKSKKPLKLIPLISNHDETKWRPEFVEAILNDPVKQDRLLLNISNTIQSLEVEWINLDFEGFDEKLLPLYLDFIKRASIQLHERNLKLALCLSPHWKSIINEELGEALDLIIPMIYDEHWSTSTPGPIASDSWFQTTFERIRSILPSEKLMVGVGNYAYDWPENGNGRDISVETALQIAKENHARIKINPESNNPMFRYVDDQLVKHQVWLLNAHTLQNQINFLKDYDIKGITLWQLGAEDPKIWEFYGSSPR
jgi:spore germination protein YaaH